MFRGSLFVFFSLLFVDDCLLLADCCGWPRFVMSCVLLCVVRCLLFVCCLFVVCCLVSDDVLVPCVLCVVCCCLLDSMFVGC